jgi:hypothetical protein
MRDEQQDLKLLADAFFDELMWLDYCYGAPGLDPKRPFGNSNVERDILEILDAEPEDEGDFSDEQFEYARTLYREKLIPYLREQWAKLNAAPPAASAS